MNRLKTEQKNKVGKRKIAQSDNSDIETGVKVARTGGTQRHISNPGSSSQGLAQSTSISNKKLPKNYETSHRQFVQWTQASDSVAVSFLTKANWNIEYAMTLYFDNPHLFSGPPAQPSFDRSKMERLFYQYTDQRDNVGEKRMGPHGISRLLQDLSYSPTDRRVLILAWMFKAQTQCEFSLEEWVQGLTGLGVDTVQGLQQRIDMLNTAIQTDKSKFRELYMFAFTYGKAASSRSLDLNTAVCYWDVLFGPRTTIMSQWVDFLMAQENAGTAKLSREVGEQQAKQMKIVWITRDTWNLFWDFVQLSKPDLSDYDDEGAWPVMIDQFVEHCRESLNYPKPGGAQGADQPMEQQAYY